MMTTMTMYSLRSERVHCHLDDMSYTITDISSTDFYRFYGRFLSRIGDGFFGV